MKCSTPSLHNYNIKTKSKSSLFPLKMVNWPKRNLRRKGKNSATLKYSLTWEKQAIYSSPKGFIIPSAWSWWTRTGGQPNPANKGEENEKLGESDLRSPRSQQLQEEECSVSAMTFIFKRAGLWMNHCSRAQGQTVHGKAPRGTTLCDSSLIHEHTADPCHSFQGLVYRHRQNKTTRF